MSEENPEPTVDLIALTTEIVAAYVRNNSLPRNELSQLIADTHAAFAGLACGNVATQREEKPAPAVSIRKSVTPDFLMSRRQNVYQTLEEPLQIHRSGSSQDRQRRIHDLLDLVALPRTILDRLPRSLSGGQRQRVSIARALALQPSILICDEPLSALDVSIRTQIVNLFMALQRQLGLTILIVAHDLAIVREVCSAVTVMYLGRVAEAGSTRQLFHQPAHPYSQALLSAVPSPDPRIEIGRRRIILAGDPPSPSTPPPGCRFHTRCPVSISICQTTEPSLRVVPHGGEAACHLADHEKRPLL